MVEKSSRVGRFEAGRYWVEDVRAGVQIGWIERDDQDGRWYILDNEPKRRAGPFRTLRNARRRVDEFLESEFGFGNPGS